MRYDAAIIGSGPAGAEAAINLKIRNKNIILFGDSELSKKLTAAPKIDNYLGLPGISGKELQEKILEHLSYMDISIMPQQIQMVYRMGNYFSLAAGTEIFEATAVVLAPGAYSAKMVEGEDRFLGSGVSYCATCDAPLYRGKTVAVLGYSGEAAQEADYLAELAGRVYYVPMGKSPAKPGEKVEVVSGKVKAIEGDSAVRRLILEAKALDIDGIFILRDMVAPSALVPGVETQDGYIKVDDNMATNLPGCFAAGDCTGRPHQYMRAAGQGQTAALGAAAYLDSIRESKK